MLEPILATTFLQGLALSAAMILPLGPQNVFVMNQGVKRHYHLMVASFCSFSDIALIYAGIFGGSVILQSSSLLLTTVTWGGIAFLLWYGWGAWRSVFNAEQQIDQTTQPAGNRWRILLMVFAVTWLNPHVYLDTFVVLGSIGAQFSTELRTWFFLGAMLSSCAWFFSLALLAAWLAPWLQIARTQRLINVVVGVVMWSLAAQLAYHTLSP